MSHDLASWWTSHQAFQGPRVCWSSYIILKQCPHEPAEKNNTASVVLLLNVGFSYWTKERGHGGNHSWWFQLNLLDLQQNSWGYVISTAGAALALQFKSDTVWWCCDHSWSTMQLNLSFAYQGGRWTGSSEGQVRGGVSEEYGSWSSLLSRCSPLLIYHSQSVIDVLLVEERERESLSGFMKISVVVCEGFLCVVDGFQDFVLQVFFAWCNAFKILLSIVDCRLCCVATNLVFGDGMCCKFSESCFGYLISTLSLLSLLKWFIIIFI
jgi:hypothetical protein